MHVPLRLRAEVMLGRMRDPASERGSLQVPYLRAANVSDGLLSLDDVKSMHFDPREQQRYRLKAGDVLVTEASGSRDQVGQSALVDEPAAGHMFQNTLLRLRPLGATEARFLYWWSRHAFASGTYARAAQGLGIWHVGAERLRALAFPEMTPPDQRRVADFLDEPVALLDRAIHLRKQQLRLVEETAASGMSELVDKAFELFGSVALRRVTNGIEQGTSPDCFSFPANPGEYGVLKVSAVRHGRFRSIENKALPRNIPPDPRYLVSVGDVLLTRGSGSRDLVGDVAVVTEAHGALLLLPDLLYRLRLLDGWAPAFLVACLLSPRMRAEVGLAVRGAVGGTMKLRGVDILDLRIPPCDAGFQAALARKWSGGMDWKAAAQMAMEASERLLQERKQALITAAVTGEFDVTTASARSVA